MSEQEQEHQQDPLIELAKKWLSRFETCIRRRMYEPAKAMCHERLVWFGIESNITFGWKQTEEKEWKETWPKQLAFTFDLGKAQIIVHQGIIFCLLPWKCRGLIHGSAEKSGRASIVLGVFDEDHKLLCMHVHLSINPITRIAIPQN